MSTFTESETSAWLDAPPLTDTRLELPQWYLDFQKNSWERFLQLPLPTRYDENWRYADLKKSRFGRLSPALPARPPAPSAAKELPHAIARFVFVNGTLAEYVISPSLPEGVICAPINEAIASGGERLRPFFDLDAPRLGTEKFAALHGASINYGIFVHVPKGIEIQGEIHVQHYISGDAAPVFPRTLIVARDHASVSIVESFASVNDSEPGLSIGICDLHADNGAKIEHILVQNLNAASKQVHLGSSHTGKDSSIRSVLLNLGGAWVRNESINRMTASGADTRVYGANLSDGLQEIDQRTLQIHDAQHTTSDLLIKNALYGQSRIIFGGLIQVLPGAHHTDSFQSCRSLMSSEDAEINAMPGLEIDADQVRCSHGATSGEISEDELFYLRSRGIPTDEARRIISCGFLHEALERIGDEAIIDWLADQIEEKFARLS